MRDSIDSQTLEVRSWEIVLSEVVKKTAKEYLDAINATLEAYHFFGFQANRWQFTTQKAFDKKILRTGLGGTTETEPSPIEPIGFLITALGMGLDAVLSDYIREGVRA